MIKQDSFILVWMEEIIINNNISENGGVVAEGLSLRIDAGEYVCISGLYGSEKISFINTLSCLDRPAGGRYIYDYNDIRTASDNKLGQIRSSIGFLFRNLNIIEQLTVYKNIELPLLSRKQKADNKVMEAARRLGLNELLNIEVKKLSDLDKHKVALARALVVDPVLIIADEPAEGLNLTETEEVLQIIDDINKSGTAVICFSERQQILSRASRNIMLDQGRIKADSGSMACNIEEGAI